MKAIILIVAILFSVLGLQANEPQTVVYSNEIHSQAGLIKEFITYDKSESRALSKVVYNYDNAGLLQRRTIYEWDMNNGWVGTQKYEYECNNSGKVINVIYTKWDDKLNTWASVSDQQVYIYNSEGDLMATKQIRLNNETGSLATIK